MHGPDEAGPHTEGQYIMTNRVYGCVHPARQGSNLKCRNAGPIHTPWGPMCVGHARALGWPTDTATTDA